MKKIIFTLLALVGTMSMNAQIVELYKGDVLVAKYKASEVDNVVFKEAPAFGQGEAAATGIGKVKWVQLWENGPKFAEYNVGATSPEEFGGYYEWADDIATTQWGSNWRMPTVEELKLLKGYCTWTYTTETKVPGYWIKGKEDYAENSIFLPCAGYYEDGLLVDAGHQSYIYWTSEFDVEEAYGLIEYNGTGYNVRGANIGNRKYLCSVRAVLAE